MRCDYCKTWHEWTIWETKLLPEGWEFQTGLSGVRVLCMKCHDSYKEGDTDIGKFLCPDDPRLWDFTKIPVVSNTTITMKSPEDWDK